MRRLAAGENVVSEMENTYPFKHAPEQNTRPSWELGTLSRIEESAPTCDLCRLALRRVHELERELAWSEAGRDFTVLCNESRHTKISFSAPHPRDAAHRGSGMRGGRLGRTDP
jgi:hypothetical protein